MSLAISRMGMLHGQVEVIAEPDLTTKPPGATKPRRPCGQRRVWPLHRLLPQGEPSVPGKNPAMPATYKVAAGDTLSKTASSFYDDAMKWREIASAIWVSISKS